MKLLPSIIFILIASVGLSGCGNRFFSERETNPVTEDYLRSGFIWDQPEYGLLSTTASRRLVLVDFKRHKFCSEPPPDAAEAVASNKALEVSADSEATNATGQKLKAEAALQYQRNFATTVAALVRRTQGLQWARDREAALCTLFMQGTIDEKSYIDDMREVRKMSFKLIEGEFKHMPDMMKAITGAAPNTNPSKKSTN